MSPLEIRAQKFLNDFYASKGYTVDRKEGKENRSGDLWLTGENGIRTHTEEKSLRYDSGLSFEIIQDAMLLTKVRWIDDHVRVPLNCLGNQFVTDAKLQVWYCEDNDGKSSHVYWVSRKRLHDWYLTKNVFGAKDEKGHNKYKPKAIPEGYGLTISTHLPWRALIDAQVARIWWPQENEV